MNQHADTRTRPAGILIVEDSPTQAKNLELILAEQGYRVSVARSGEEAMALITADRPDLLISDILMPEMDGFELCRRIRESDGARDIPIILLTLLNDPTDVLRSLEAGADYFISKPYSNEFLLSRVSRTLLNGRDCRTGPDDGKMEVNYNDRSYTISAGKSGIIEFLLATYETAVEKNRELMSTQKALRDLNQQLENRVSERTAALMAETAQRLQAMEDLREKDRLLMQQSRQAAMGEMIGNIAHQWRQPLNGLGLMIQTLSMSYETGNVNLEYLESFEEKAMQVIAHMSQTIDDFRNYFKPDKEKIPFHVSRAVSKTVSMIEDSFRSLQIAIEIDAEDDPVVNGYPNEFSQVLLNVLLNARDAFSEREIGKQRVVITMTAENGKAVITVTDNAGGIPEDTIDRIFDPYFTTKGPDHGTGVGLFMSKGIIEKNMGGRLTARNTGDGAEFRIEV
ncbi:MAG TPA: hybrid sensor histidine kinase/response regulator [Geobacteraceae bacterium]|nr:hybrid sensor histidine kinase/response regulator [Geobacteraceae bacterium]